MAALLHYFSGSHVLNFASAPLLLVQCALLHPAYEADPSARVIRLILLPIIVALTLSTQSRKLFYPLEEYLPVNYGLVAIPSVHVCCLAVQLALHRGPSLKSEFKSDKKNQSSHEVQCNSASAFESAEKSNDANSEGRMDELAQKFSTHKQLKATHGLDIRKSPSVFELIKFSIAMVTSPRGLQYTWAPPSGCLSKVPKKSPAKFLCERLCSVLKMHVFFLVTCAYLLPAINHSDGPAGWMSEVAHVPKSNWLNIFAKHATSITLTCLAICGFNLLGSLLNIMELLAITISRFILPSGLRPDPFDTSQYPPLFNRLGSRDNLADFWGKGWHCVFRRDFVFCGGLPISKIGTFLFGRESSRAFWVMGSMLFSGIFHEWGLLMVAKPDFKFNTTKFFVLQGIGILIENGILKRPLAHRNLRYLRYLFTYFWLIYWSQGMFEALYDRGLGKSGIIDPDFRNWYWFQYLLPFGPFLPRGSINWIA